MIIVYLYQTPKRCLKKLIERYTVTDFLISNYLVMIFSYLIS